MPTDYALINVDKLESSDRRRGYGTPTVLYNGRDLFGMAAPPAQPDAAPSAISRNDITVARYRPRFGQCDIARLLNFAKASLDTIEPVSKLFELIGQTVR